MTLYETYRHFQRQLAEKYDSHEADAITRIIFEHITGYSRADIIKNNDLPVPAATKEQLQQALERLYRMEPLQYLTGEAFFCNRIFKVSPSVLIPRPETEQLVKMALDFLSGQTVAKVFEVGSGSGCISISLKLALPTLQISSIDISDEALKIAINNSMKYKTAIDWIQEDFMDKALWYKYDEYDLIISNPPYIPRSESVQMGRNVTEYEPHLALFVTDNDPLIFYRKIAIFGKTHLNRNGKIIVECHQDWVEECLNLFVEEGYEGEAVKDIFDNNRFVTVSRCH